MSERDACSGNLCGFGRLWARGSHLPTVRPEAPETKRPRPALRFRFPPALGPGRLAARSRAAGRVQKISGAAQSFPGRIVWVGGPSRELTASGHGDPEPSRPCPRWSRPGGIGTCDLPQGGACRRRPGVRGAFPAAPPGPRRRGPERVGAEPRAKGALTLARQVGGGGAGSAGGEGGGPLSAHQGGGWRGAGRGGNS
jgi:hypothetical protein